MMGQRLGLKSVTLQVIANRFVEVGVEREGHLLRCRARPSVLPREHLDDRWLQIHIRRRALEELLGSWLHKVRQVPHPANGRSG
jgi:hypothetical protein